MRPLMKKRHGRRFSEYMVMMRKHDPQVQEDGFHALLPRVREFIEDLLNEFRAETHDHGLQRWLLELIAEAADERALKVLLQQLRSEDASLRYWAIYGLRKLDTVEARRALFEAGVPKPLLTHENPLGQPEGLT